MISRNDVVRRAVVLAGLLPATVSAQRSVTAVTSVVFDGVTVVDVEQGKLVPDQRVVIAGNRIQAVGSARAIAVPNGAQVVAAQGKYLIPGLWDMHFHLYTANMFAAGDTSMVYRHLIVAGVTGIRDPGSAIPLVLLRRLRQEVLAGRLVGPPRQLFSGQSIMGPGPKCNKDDWRDENQTCVVDSADAVHFVDSLEASGADMIKPREVTRAMYFLIAAEARRLGIPFGGHASYVTELEAADSGARIVDHAWGDAGCAYKMNTADWSDSDDLYAHVMGSREWIFKELETGDPDWEACQRQAAERFRRNNTWFVPTFGAGTPEEVHASSVWKQPDFPLLNGTDAGTDGTAVPTQLDRFVRSGLTPATALRTATLNPAKMLGATDSLGTVSAGKLADLVLLDANPFADINNVKQVRAVMANGRYFDRAALDTLLAINARVEAERIKEIQGAAGQGKAEQEP